MIITLCDAFRSPGEPPSTPLKNPWMALAHPLAFFTAGRHETSKKTSTSS